MAVLAAVKAPKDRDPEGFLAGLLLAFGLDKVVVLGRFTLRWLSGGAIRVGLSGAVALRGAGGGRRGGLVHVHEMLGALAVWLRLPRSLPNFPVVF